MGLQAFPSGILVGPCLVWPCRGWGLRSLNDSGQESDECQESDRQKDSEGDPEACGIFNWDDGGKALFSPAVLRVASLSGVSLHQGLQMEL